MEEKERPASQDDDAGRETEAEPKLEEIEPQLAEPAPGSAEPSPQVEREGEAAQRVEKACGEPSPAARLPVEPETQETETEPETDEAEPQADGEQTKETEVRPQAVEAPQKPMDRKSVLLWVLIIVALAVAVAVLMGRPFLTYRALADVPPGGKRDTLIRSLEKQGPVGTEFARRYVAGLFREERASGVYMVVKHQSLFHALPFSRVAKYLGEPDTRTGTFTDRKVEEGQPLSAQVKYRFANYRVGEGRLLSVRIRDGVVRAIYLDTVTPVKDKASSSGRPALEPKDRVLKQERPPLME